MTVLTIVFGVLLLASLGVCIFAIRELRKVATSGFENLKAQKLLEIAEVERYREETKLQVAELKDAMAREQAGNTAAPAPRVVRTVDGREFDPAELEAF